MTPCALGAGFFTNWKNKSIADGQVYAIDGRDCSRNEIELRSGVKVLLAPVEDHEGNDYARVIKIIELNVVKEMSEANSTKESCR